MSEKISLEIDIEDGNSIQTLGGLREEFERLNAEINKVDVNSKEFQELQKEIVKTGGQVKNLELSMESLNSEGVASAIGGLAGGIGGVTSALVLMGGENETVKEMTENIQNAMAISMGLKGAVEGASFGYKLFNNVLKTNSVVMWLSAKATSGFGKALIATGIGAIVVLLGLLIANFETVTKWVGKATDKFLDLANNFKDLGIFMKLALAPLYPFIVAIKGVIAVLRKFGIMETEVAKKVRLSQEKIVKSYDDRIKKLDELIAKTKDTYDHEVWQMDRQINLLKAQGKDVSKLEEERLNVKIKGSLKEHQLASLRLADLLQQQQVIKDLGGVEDKRYKEIEKNIQKEIDLQKKSDVNYRNQLDALEVYKATKQKESNDRYREHLAEKKAIDKEYFDELREFEQEQQEKDREEMLASMEDDALFKQQLQEGLREIELGIAEEQELEDWELEEQRLEKLNQLKRDKEAQELADKQKSSDKRNEMINNGLSNSMEALNSLSALNSAFLERDLQKAGNNEAKKEQLRRASFEREKKMNIAKALINGAQAIMTTLASTPPPLSYILAGATAVMTGVQVATIKNAKYSGGGSVPSLGGLASAGGSAGGGVDINPVSNTSTTIGDQKVFVTESDITSTQNSVEVIEQQATF